METNDDELNINETEQNINEITTEDIAVEFNEDLSEDDVHDLELEAIYQSYLKEQELKKEKDLEKLLEKKNKTEENIHEKIKNVANEFIGENNCSYTVLNKESGYLYIKFKDVAIKNSSSHTTLINEIIVRIFFIGLYHDKKKDNINFKIGSIDGLRTLFSEDHLNSGYCHSHLRSGLKNNFDDFCLGTGILSFIKNRDKVKKNDGEFENYIYSILMNVEDYIKWESLEGGPYFTINSITSSRRNSPTINTLFYLCRLNNSSESNFSESSFKNFRDLKKIFIDIKNILELLNINIEDLFSIKSGNDINFKVENIVSRNISNLFNLDLFNYDESRDEVKIFNKYFHLVNESNSRISNLENYDSKNFGRKEPFSVIKSLIEVNNNIYYYLKKDLIENKSEKFIESIVDECNSDVFNNQPIKISVIKKERDENEGVNLIKEKTLEEYNFLISNYFLTLNFKSVYALRKYIEINFKNKVSKKIMI